MQINFVNVKRETSPDQLSHLLTFYVPILLNAIQYFNDAIRTHNTCSAIHARLLSAFLSNLYLNAKTVCDIETTENTVFLQYFHTWNAKVKREKNFYKLTRQHPAGSKHFFGLKFFATYVRHVVLCLYKKHFEWRNSKFTRCESFVVIKSKFVISKCIF